MHARHTTAGAVLIPSLALAVLACSDASHGVSPTLVPIPPPVVPAEGVPTPPIPGAVPEPVAGDGAALPPQNVPGEPAPTDPTATEPPAAPMLAMDECGLHTKYAGDEYCILPPPPDKGFQIHIGPSNYDNPEPQYILAAHQELTTDFPTVSGNDTDVYFYYRQFRMRTGAHHNIITTSDGGGFGMGRRIGTSNNLAEDNPKDGVIAPENQGVGIPLAPKSAINVSLHSINVTDAPQLRELWINFWYRDPAQVTEPVQEMFQTGSVTFAVQPGQDTILGPFNCALTGSGRMLWMYGHRHANNVRFSTWRVRGAQRDLIYEAYNWEEPLLLEYASNVQNAVPDQAMGIEGGWSGVLDLMPGDLIEWECHVINQNPSVLRFTNNTYTGEMCIVDAELVGTNCAPGLGLAP